MLQNRQEYIYTLPCVWERVGSGCIHQQVPGVLHHCVLCRGVPVDTVQGCSLQALLHGAVPGCKARSSVQSLLTPAWEMPGSFCSSDGRFVTRALQSISASCCFGFGTCPSVPLSRCQLSILVKNCLTLPCGTSTGMSPEPGSLDCSPGTITVTVSIPKPCPGRDKP